jgi:ornithine carbamoyltransferase
MRSHADLMQLAGAAEKPVINALTDRSHPCQILADLMTLEEASGPIGEQRVVYIGDGNNIATSLIEAAALLGFRLTVITPPGYEPSHQALDRARGIGTGITKVHISNDIAALDGATAVYTDVWASMGQEDQRATRKQIFAPYQVNQRLMDAAKGAVFLHCLPAHRGEEVTDDVIDGPRSKVFDQAGNRLYAQMALMAKIMETRQA